MRTIGLLGGMSWESTVLYYRVANELVRERLGGLASAELLVRNLDFRRIRACQVEDRWDDAATVLAAEAVALQNAGADVVLLCTNYMHKCAPAVEAALSVPFLHIADAVAAAARGLTVLVPEPADVERVDAAIFDELCRGRAVRRHPRRPPRGDRPARRPGSRRGRARLH